MDAASTMLNPAGFACHQMLRNGNQPFDRVHTGGVDLHQDFVVLCDWLFDVLEIRASRGRHIDSTRPGLVAYEWSKVCRVATYFERQLGGEHVKNLLTRTLAVRFGEEQLKQGTPVVIGRPLVVEAEDVRPDTDARRRVLEVRKVPPQDRLDTSTYSAALSSSPGTNGMLKVSPPRSA